MGLRLFFLPNFPVAMFIQGATFIPDSRVKKSHRYNLDLVLQLGKITCDNLYLNFQFQSFS